MSEEVQKQPESQTYGDEKARFECEKLKAEIESIRRPLFKTPAFYAAVAPVTLVFLGLLFTQLSGWFDVQRTRVNNEKTLLEAQTERLRIERTTMEAQAREQQARFASAEAEINKLRENEANLTNQVARLERDRNELRSAKELLENETKRLAGSDAKASQFLEQLKTLQTTREQLLTNLEALQVSDATLRVTTERQSALIRWANEVLSEGWSIALKDRSTWAKFIDFGGHVLDIHVASMSYLPEWQLLPVVRAAGDEQSRIYDRDARWEAEKWRSQIDKKSASDYVREAKEHFELLNGVRFSNTNSESGTSPSPPPVPPQNPQSP